MSFIIYTLPRSMSTWLAHFLYEKDRPCFHDKSQEWTNNEDMINFFNKGQCGITDTALILKWKEVKTALPKVKTVAVFRDADEVFSELDSIGMYSNKEQQEQLLKACVEYDGPKISFEFLKTEEGIQTLCSILGIEFDKQKYQEFKETNIQPLLVPMLLRHSQNLQNIKEFYKEYI